MALSKKLHDLKVVLHNAVAALAEPTDATGGAAITGWGAYRHDALVVAIDAASGAGSITVSSGVLLGYDASDGEWRHVAYLNAGNDITLTQNVGFEQRFADAGVFDRLAVQATLSGDTVTVSVKPVERLEV